jgi:hypothetical protein
MMRALITAPEFWSEAAWNAKLKKPLELVASAARALDARPGPETGRRSAGFHLARATNRLGERLFYAQPPTGHPDTAEAWMNTGTLLARLNFAVTLAQNRLPGVRVALESFLGDVDRRRPEAVLDRLLAVTLHGQVSARTRETLVAQLHDAARVRPTAGSQGAADTDIGNLAALVLGSPDFQRR